MKPIVLILLLSILGAVPLSGAIHASEGVLISQDPPSAQSQTSGQTENSSQQAQASQSQTSTQTTTASSSISALGSVEPNSVASLQFEISGTTNGVYVTLGDYVKAGEVLADLKSDDAWNTYNQAVLAVESVQIAMNDLKEPATVAELAVAKANITSAQAAYSSAANSTSEAQLANAQLQYDQAQAQLAALQDARAHMGGTDEQIALQDAQIGAASFNAEIARLQLEEMQKPNSSALWSASIRIKQAQLELDQLQQGPTQDELNSAQIAIDRAQANLSDAETALQKVQLVAPISGYVTAVNVSTNQAVSTGTVAVEISDLSALHMTVPINELDVDRIQEGEDASIKLDALTDLTIPGKIEHVGWLSETSSDGIVTYDVQVVLNTTDARVRIGMTGEVTIETGSTNS